MKWLRRLTRPSQARSDVDRRPEESADSLSAGLKRANEGQWTDAAEHFQEAVRFDPQSAEAHHNLSVALSRIGDFEGAFSSAEAATELVENSAAFLLNFGNAAIRVDQTEMAEAAFRNALELDPENTSAHSNLGILHCQQKSWDSAIFHLTKANATEHPNPSVLVPLAIAYRNSGKVESARATVDRLLQSYPDSIDGLLESIRIHQALTNWQEAGYTAEKIIELAPDHFEGRYFLALSLHKQGQSETAVGILGHLEEFGVVENILSCPV